MTERKNYLKLYQKQKYRKYQIEVDNAIKMSLVDAYGENAYENQDMTYENLLSLQEKIGFVKIGLTDEQIQDIPISKLDELDTCSICFNQGDVGKVLLCGHFFHTECIDQWLREKKSCPLCLSEAIIR